MRHRNSTTTPLSKESRVRQRRRRVGSALKKFGSRALLQGKVQITEDYIDLSIELESESLDKRLNKTSLAFPTTPCIGSTRG